MKRRSGDVPQSLINLMTVFDTLLQSPESSLLMDGSGSQRLATLSDRPFDGGRGGFASPSQSCAVTMLILQYVSIVSA